MSNPYERSYPEGVFDKFTLELRLDRETGNYTIYCPEWRSEIAGGKYPGDFADHLIAEIVAHNRMEMEKVK